MNLHFLIFLFALCHTVEIYADKLFMPQEWVLETRKIEIPGYPHAFNPSIVKWNDSYLLSFRIVPDSNQKYTCRIGVVRLDHDFNIASKPQLLETADPLNGIPPRIDDARLLLVEGRLWMIYADNKDKEISRGGYRVYIGELQQDGENFTLINQECQSRFEGESINKREKNWTPFDYNGTLLLSYSLLPHRIFLPLLSTGECKTIAHTKSDIQWKWGDLRGGTPALLDGDHYLSFFHSTIDMESPLSSGKKMAHYFMGAYTFSKEPPFEIIQISPSPIMGKDFYTGNHYKPYWKPVTVIFPCGFVHDDQYVWLAYGQHDHEAWIAKIDKKKLMDSLVPVKTVE